MLYIIWTNVYIVSVYYMLNNWISYINIKLSKAIAKLKSLDVHITNEKIKTFSFFIFWMIYKYKCDFCYTYILGNICIWNKKPGKFLFSLLYISK